MFENLRRKFAGKFGKIEHKSGRWLGALIGIDIALELLNYNPIIYGKISFQLAALAITFLCWLTYLIAHTLEKTIYGNTGPRG